MDVDRYAAPPELVHDMAEDLYGAGWKLRDVFEAGRQTAIAEIAAEVEELGKSKLACDWTIAEVLLTIHAAGESDRG